VSIDAEERGRAALDHILEAIERYLFVVGDLSFEALVEDFTRYYAAERFVEIISEATRRLPQLEGRLRRDSLAGHCFDRQRSAT